MNHIFLDHYQPYYDGYNIYNDRFSSDLRAFKKGSPRVIDLILNQIMNKYNWSSFDIIVVCPSHVRHIISDLKYQPLYLLAAQLAINFNLMYKVSAFYRIKTVSKLSKNHKVKIYFNDIRIDDCFFSNCIKSKKLLLIDDVSTTKRTFKHYINILKPYCFDITCFSIGKTVKYL